jgi:putative spermidine/putrescine transport system ATP-binding protein
MPAAQAAEEVRRVLDIVQLPHVAGRLPKELSGGQQQRIALARCMVYRPSIILMDEPLGALDKQLREHMQLEIRELHRRLGLTIVFVTHDQSEALTMSDRIAVFNAGRVEQIDSPHVIYDMPRTRFVAEFIGETNLIEAKVASVDNHVARLSLGAGLSACAHAANGLSVGQTASFSLRPERIRLGSAPESSNALDMTIVDCIYHGDHMRVQLARDDFSLVARCERLAGNWTVGAPIVASFDPSDCTVLAQ